MTARMTLDRRLASVLASISVSISVFVVAPSALAAVRSVGPGKTYATPCAALAAAADGDVIEIDASKAYSGDVCAFNKNNLIIRGVGGRAKIDAGGKSAGGKAIWVVQGNDTTIEDVELSGCKVVDKNGAGIRQEGRNLTVRRVYFHDNENGILTGANADSTIVVEDSEFGNNGAGDGYSHNMYIGEIKSFTLRGSYSHHAKVGHLVKSRALRNHILFNRLTDENGNASYEIDLPQGGPSWIIGNVVQQSASTSNSGLVSYARESKRNPESALWVVNNTFFNSRGAGTFVAVASDLGTPVLLRNNVFAGPGTVCDQASAIKDSNFVGDPGFVNAAAWDFHLKSGATAEGKGAPPGTGGSEPLDPICQYVHPARAMTRKTVGTLDQGAFELGGETTIPCGATEPADAGGTGDAGVDAATGDAGLDAGSGDDSGGLPGGDAGADGGASGDAGADGGASGDAATDDGGCSCRVGDSDGGARALPFLALVAALWMRRRR